MNYAVLDVDYAVRVVCQLFVVRDDDEGLVHLVAQVEA